MGWTAPRTWVTNEVVTAAQLNEQIRDNELYLKGSAGAVVIEDEVRFENDAQFGARIVSSNPRWVSDTDDFIVYNRASDFHAFYVGGQEQFRVDNTGGTAWLGVGCQQGMRQIDYEENSKSCTNNTWESMTVTWDNTFTSLVGVLGICYINADDPGDHLEQYVRSRSTTGATWRVRQTSGGDLTVYGQILGIGT